MEKFNSFPNEIIVKILQPLPTFSIQNFAIAYQEDLKEKHQLPEILSLIDYEKEKKTDQYIDFMSEPIDGSMIDALKMTDDQFADFVFILLEEGGDLEKVFKFSMKYYRMSENALGQIVRTQRRLSNSILQAIALHYPYHIEKLNLSKKKKSALVLDFLTYDLKFSDGYSYDPKFQETLQKLLVLLSDRDTDRLIDIILNQSIGSGQCETIFGKRISQLTEIDANPCLEASVFSVTRRTKNLIKSFFTR